MFLLPASPEESKTRRNKVFVQQTGSRTPKPATQHNSKSSHRSESQLSFDRAPASPPGTESNAGSYVRAMNRSGRDDWSRPGFGGHHDNDYDDDDDDYAVPEEDYDDGMVHIQPAKLCPSNTQYADRGHHRPIPSVPSGVDSKSNTPPKPPRRIIPGPAVNRDLKPGRQPKTKTEVFSKTNAPAPLESHQNLRSPLSLPKPVPMLPVHDKTTVGPKLLLHGHGGFPTDPSTPPGWKELPKSVPVLPVHDKTTAGPKLSMLGHGGLPTDPPTPHMSPAWKEGSTSPRGPKARPPLSASQRLSLDLESQELFDARQIHRKEGMLELHSVKRHHHEWPQEKGDLDHSNFHPQERPAEMSDWYVGSFTRVEAEHALHLVNREGAFLVRDCSKCTPQEPLVLAVFYKHRVYNIQIRYSECSSKYTLGTGLRTNDAFDNVADIIKFHSIFPITLIDGRNPNEDQRRTCVLLYPVTRTDILQLLRKDT
ncbi:hypothetical protein AALO_G00192600 [Alosa alosa]|uniref:SH2 domain-containing protein n=1 Tax=Alosa alosa TaxID=278164 RepID=A0AAV6G992_9TELE|nr:hypothetical protein AALO_G00192600 [Alosa alosa]